MRFYLYIIYLLIPAVSVSQSEKLIPSQAATVLSINNVNLLQKVSLDSLIEYDFMDEIHNELFDGNAEGKTLKHTGFDFNQRLNIFHGYTKDYEIAGFTFGIESKKELFTIFNDFSISTNNTLDIELYASFLSKIAILENTGILYRITPHHSIVDKVTDSIWKSRGHETPWFKNDFLEEIYEEDTYGLDSTGAFEYSTLDNNTDDYYLLRDSIEISLHDQLMLEFETNFFSKKDILFNTQPLFASSLDETSDANIFIDNTRNLQLAPLGYYSNFVDNIMLPLYTNNIITGKMKVDGNTVKMNLNMGYGEKLGEIYTALTDVKWDLDLFQYINRNDPAYLTFRINTEESYHKMYEVLVPELEKLDTRKTNRQLLMIDVLDIVLNQERLLNMVNSSAFMAYKGIKQVKTSRTITEYNPTDFSTTEKIEEFQEDVPVFALGFSCGEGEAIERILNRIKKLVPNLDNNGNYWVIKDGVIRSVDLYLLITDNHFIITNDVDLVQQNANGYGSNGIPKEQLKSLKKSGITYAYADMNKVTTDLPEQMFNYKENQLLDILRQKNGSLELRSSTTGKTGTSFNIVYDTNEETNSLQYIFDLINSLYVSQTK